MNLHKMHRSRLMIDFHTHILPGIDDGSRDIVQTKELLRQAHRQGIHQILATPHFYADRDSAGQFLRKRKESLEIIQKLSENEEWIPEIKAAAEVYYFPGIGKADLLPKLCMEDRLLLLELPFAQWTSGMYRDVEEIVEKQKLTVMLAHVERYYEFQKDRRIWESMFEFPVYAQINAGSFLRHGKRSFGIKFMKAGHQVLLGSDCHHPQNRPSNLKSGRVVIEKKLGVGMLEEIDRRGRLMWEHAESFTEKK